MQDKIFFGHTTCTIKLMMNDDSMKFIKFSRGTTGLFVEIA